MAVSPAWVNLPERYSVAGHIANGGMASVWEAKDELLGRDVAVKLLAPHLGADEKARERFLREARTAATVSQHPHVVTIYDVGEHEGQSFIVMELYRGGSVGDRLRRSGAPDRSLALRWLRETAGALDAAEAGVLAALDRLEAELDGRDYLVGEAFSVADLTAAALMYPLILPPEGPQVVSRPPVGMQAFLDSVAERPGIQWVLQTYRRHRAPAVATPS